MKHLFYAGRHRSHSFSRARQRQIRVCEQGARHKESNARAVMEQRQCCVGLLELSAAVRPFAQ